MNKKDESKEILLTAIDHSLALIETGKIKNAAQFLDAVFSISKEFPGILWMDSSVWKLGKSYLIMYHVDHFDDEEVNILLAHYSFAYFYRGIEILKQSDENEETLYVAYKNLVALFKTCGDCFYETIGNFYIPQSEKNNRDVVNTARKLAMSISPYILYSFILEIEDCFGSLQNDEFLETVCTEIEKEFPEMNDDLLAEANKIIKLLFGYLKQKIASGKIDL